MYLRDSHNNLLEFITTTEHYSILRHNQAPCVGSSPNGSLSRRTAKRSTSAHSCDTGPNRVTSELPVIRAPVERDTTVTQRK